MQELEFTETKVKLNHKKSSKVKAFVAITLNNLFKISGLELVDGGREYYIQYPTYTRLSGEVKPACYSLCEKLQQKILSDVLEKYWEVKKSIS